MVTSRTSSNRGVFKDKTGDEITGVELALMIVENKDALKGDVQIPGYLNSIRLYNFPDIAITNELSRTRGGSRKAANPETEPLILETSIGSHVNMAIQCALNGTNLKKMMIVRLLSEDSDAEHEDLITLLNPVLVKTTLMGGEQDTKFRMWVKYDDISQVSVSYKQDKTSEGQVGVYANTLKQSPNKS